jgi:hypothetical protein
MQDMLHNWDRRFPGCPPIGHRLRHALPERWVRFHSLPEAKRYPENDAEYAEVLARHNAILGELTQTSKKIVLITTSYSEASKPAKREGEIAQIDLQAVWWRTLAMHEEDADFANPSYWHFFASLHNWQPGLFNAQIRLVADDILSNVLIVSEDCGWVLHPYDGGMDVITGSIEERNRLRKKFRRWSSQRVDGL